MADAQRTDRKVPPRGQGAKPTATNKVLDLRGNRADHRGMVVSRDDLEASLVRVRAGVIDPRHGIHGPGSAAWHLERDALVFLGGGRAALLQLAHPVIATGVDQHSRTRADVVGRFQRTFVQVFAMSFGDLDDAFRAARRVHTIHTHITGTFPETIGPFAAGTTYRANDADALTWVYATLVDTVVQVTELVRGRLPTASKDAYVRASWQFARLFGIPDDRLAADWAGFRRYMTDMLASPTLTVSPAARSMASFLFGRGDGQAQAPVAAVAEMITTGLLPPRLRAGFGLDDGPRQRLGFAAMMAALRPAARLTPRRLHYLPAYVAAQRRLRGQPPSEMAAWVEQRLFALAGQVAR
jgi:uncharacterized protein (DUF2236 family)